MRTLYYKSVFHYLRLSLFSILLSLPLMIFPMECFARAGGGGGGGGGILAIILAPFFMIYAWHVNKKLREKNARVERVLAEISATDKRWDETLLVNKARQSFFMLQQAWSEQDLVTMKKLLHPSLYPSWESQINAQIANHQVDTMSNVSIKSIMIVDARNYLDDERDCFTVCIDAAADDHTLTNGIVTKKDDGDFREFWTFEWHNNDWLLLEVYQSSAWKKFVLMDIIYEHPSLTTRKIKETSDQ